MGGIVLAALVGSWFVEGAVPPPSPSPAAGEPIVAVLCYHDVADDPRGRVDTVSPAALRAQVKALKAGGWQFATVSQLVALRDRPEKLPARVAVLTFDDGLASAYHHVLPMLREEQIPATLAIVPSFLDRPPADLPAVLTWDQLREIAHSGWVEIASHTDALHVLAPGNPQGSMTAAVSTRLYLAEEGRYEDRAEYRARIAEDLARSKQVLEERLGVPVRALAWPYGEHTAVARELARQSGFTATLGLDGGAARVVDLAERLVPRHLVTRGDRIGDADLTKWLVPDPNPILAADVSLDDLYDDDPEKLAARVDETIRKLWRLGATHVFLQGCADPRGFGYLEGTYFMNHQAPVRADVWAMVAGRMKRAGLRVWMRAPALNLTWEWERHPEWRIAAPAERGSGVTGSRYFRVAPDHEAARRAALDFFNDLAVYAPIDGLLFDEDAFLTESEPLASSPGASAADKALAIEAYLDEVKRTVRAWRPLCRFGRVVSPEAAGTKGVDERTSQDVAAIASRYDLTVVLVPEESDARGAEKLARRALARLGTPTPGRPRILFSVAASPDAEAALAAVRRAGGVHLGVHAMSSETRGLRDNLFRAGAENTATSTYATAR